MRAPLLALALTLAPLAVAAEGTPMTAEEFDAYVTGKTLTYSQYGNLFGIEEYLPDRKVRWKYSEDICQYGSWFQREDMICFVYEYDEAEHCWKFWHEGDGLTALSINDAPGAELKEDAQTTNGLNCPGPDVGV